MISGWSQPYLIQICSSGIHVLQCGRVHIMWRSIILLPFNFYGKWYQRSMKTHGFTTFFDPVHDVIQDGYWVGRSIGKLSFGDSEINRRDTQKNEHYECHFVSKRKYFDTLISKIFRPMSSPDESCCCVLLVCVTTRVDKKLPYLLLSAEMWPTSHD